MIWLLLALLPLGRYAGGAHNDQERPYRLLFKPCSPAIGVIFGLLLGASGWPLAGFAVAGWLAEKPDPDSDALGAIVHGEEDLDEYTALAWRGAVAALCYLVLMPWYDTAALTAFVVAYPLAAFIGTKLPSRDRAFSRHVWQDWLQYDAWEWSEILRYFLAGLFIIIVQ